MTWTGRGAGLSAVTIAKRLRNRVIRHLPLSARICEASRRGHVMMIHIGRSGSTVVGDLLNQHPRIAWDGEIYQTIFKERERDDGTLPPIADVDPLLYLKRRSGRAFGAWYGFEVKFFHLRALGVQLPVYLDAVGSQLPNLRYVVLERRNRLRMIASALAARATGAYHFPLGADVPRSRVRIDPRSVAVNRSAGRPLLDILQEFDRDFGTLLQLLAGSRYLHLTYEEDVLGDPRSAYRRICHFLGVEPMHAAPVRYQRSNPGALADLVENHEEVAVELRGTSYRWMLDAV